MYEKIKRVLKNQQSATRDAKRLLRATNYLLKMKMLRMKRLGDDFGRKSIFSFSLNLDITQFGKKYPRTRRNHS